MLQEIESNDKINVKHRVLLFSKELQSRAMLFKVKIIELVQLCRVFAHGKRLDLFCNSGCQLALKNKQKRF